MANGVEQDVGVEGIDEMEGLDRVEEGVGGMDEVEGFDRVEEGVGGIELLSFPPMLVGDPPGSATPVTDIPSSSSSITFIFRATARDPPPLSSKTGGQDAALVPKMASSSS